MPRKVFTLTGLDTQHLDRPATSILTNMLDNIMTDADVTLEESLAKNQRLSTFHLYSLMVLYHELEDDMLNYAGYHANYHSYNSGKPVVRRYGWDSFVTWTGVDVDDAELARGTHNLRRYRLFTHTLNIRDRWQYNHSGQLILPRVIISLPRRLYATAGL